MAEVNTTFRFMMVMYVFMFVRLCYTENSNLTSFRSPQEDVEVQTLLSRLNKHPVKSITSSDGDIIDCVHISHQLAFDHPLLKNHTIKMRPSYHPNRINLDDIKVSSLMNTSSDGLSSSPITQLWHSNGKCPKGTIPIRRTTKEDILRASSLKSYGKKKSSFVTQPSIIDAKLDQQGHHEYAYAYASGEFYGTKATLNLWNPKVQESNEFSLAQIWIIGGSTDTIEAGWQVYPGMYGDTNTRLFIYWTSDWYKTTGCYNLCSGFVQTNNKIAIGGSISPTSQIDGSQAAITILIWKDGKNGDWWMQLNGEQVGYWPSSLYSQLSKSASMLEWGGEVVNLGLNGQHTTTQMGSGQFPQQGFRKASYIRSIQTVDGTNTLRTPNLNSAHQEGCYDISTRFSNDSYWGAHFYFGGPGRNPNCQ
ncbi:protein neprosin-like [Bidens hawaiensis]|uniref:protein neprosin-like n=1 Tax=Bidens hawaiensis TaxID=980011 RepID=UPI00404B6251